MKHLLVFTVAILLALFVFNRNTIAQECINQCPVTTCDQQVCPSPSPSIDPSPTPSDDPSPSPTDDPSPTPSPSDPPSNNNSSSDSNNNNNNSGGSSQNTTSTGQILGASTLAPTGNSNLQIGLALIFLGVMVGLSSYVLKKKFS